MTFTRAIGFTRPYQVKRAAVFRVHYRHGLLLVPLRPHGQRGGTMTRQVRPRLHVEEGRVLSAGLDATSSVKSLI